MNKKYPLERAMCDFNELDSERSVFSEEFFGDCVHIFYGYREFGLLLKPKGLYKCWGTLRCSDDIS